MDANAPHLATAFYVEDLSAPEIIATRLVAFMQFSSGIFFVTNPRPWAAHGYYRVYFEPRSQNSLPAFILADRWFYDGDDNEVYARSPTLGRNLTLHEVSTNFSRELSGAKTRQWLQEFSEAFYEQSAYWD